MSLSHCAIIKVGLWSASVAFLGHIHRFVCCCFVVVFIFCYSALTLKTCCNIYLAHQRMECSNISFVRRQIFPIMPPIKIIFT